MLVQVNGVDLTPLISEKSYKMNAESVYESWLDGNYREHRVHTRSRIKGSFTICLYGQTINNTEFDTEAFLSNWDEAVDDSRVVTIGVFVQNTNSFEAIEAYYNFEGTFHREMINGNYCDKLTVNIIER